MVSDGVLDALPPKNAEEILKDVILKQRTDNAQEMARQFFRAYYCTSTAGPWMI